jgi:hypothetical protein
MGGDIVEQGEVGSPGSDGASPYLRRRLPASIRRSTILAKHRLEAYATLTSSRGGCWLVDSSAGDLEASLHTPED